MILKRQDKLKITDNLTQSSALMFGTNADKNYEFMSQFILKD
jgi:hypothetical protein